MFQSSSSQKAGCKSQAANPIRATIDVSILIQPEGRMQAPAAGIYLLTQDVSILIQPEGRMQVPDLSWPPTPQLEQFQSSSSLKAGCKARHPLR